MRVTVLSAGGERKTIHLRGDLAKIGRSRQSDIFLPDVYVSRSHAELFRTPAGWMIRDVGSRGGTFLNGRRISAPVPVKEGDVLRLGNSTLAFGETVPGEEPVIVESDRITPEATVYSYRSTSEPADAWPRVVVRAVRELARHGPSDATLADILRMAVEAVDGERGALALIGADGRLRIKLTVPEGIGSEIVVPQSIKERVTGRREAVFFEDIADDEELAQAQSIAAQGIRSFYCAPLGEEGDVRGLFYIDSRSHLARFRRSRLELVATLASVTGIALEFERARRVAERNRRMQVQLDAAAEIQGRLLPGTHPLDCPGFRAAAHHRACETVGGDLYDIWRHGDGAGVMIADVAGKGLSAALITATLHAAWHGARNSGLPPDRWLERVNEQLLPLLPDNRFATLGFALADPATGTIRIAGAGHTPALLFTRDGVSAIPATAPVVGLFPDFESQLIERPFHHGDLLLLCSDGALDQRNAAGEPFGEERLAEVVCAHAGSGAAGVIESVVRAIADHCGGCAQDDDLTLVALARE